MPSYSDRCHIKSIESKKFKTVYLDTKYWVILRDVKRGIINDPEKVHLYKLVLELSSRSQVIFPFSESLFEEFLKQTDEESLSTTLSLIKLLSKNTGIRPYKDRVAVEFEFLLRFLFDPESMKISYIESCSEYVWTCVAYSWGKFTVKDTGEHHDSYDEKVQDLYFGCDEALNEYLKLLGSMSGFGMSYPDPTSKILGRRESKSEKNSEVLIREFISELLDQKNVISNVFSNIVERFSAEDMKSFVSIILDKKVRNKLHDFIPSMNTYTTICATWIVSQNKNIKINDFFDMHHAAAALPYFDLFLTEKSLFDAINRVVPKNLPFERVKVCADISNAINLLEQLNEQ